MSFISDSMNGQVLIDDYNDALSSQISPAVQNNLETSFQTQYDRKSSTFR